MRVVLEHPAFVWDQNSPRMSPIGFADCSIVPRCDNRITAWYLVKANGDLEWIQGGDVIVRLEKGNYCLLKGVADNGGR